MANWEKEQSDIETDTKLTPEEKEKAKIESTAKALEMVDKQNFEGFKKYRTINGLLYIHEKTSDHTLDYIRVYDKSKEVGHLFYGEEKQGDGFLKGGVQVDESLQRKGIASRMYEMAEQVSGMKFVPDTPHSKSAEKLWASSSRRFGKDKSGVTIEQSISEAYHKAKADGSNPELVAAVEELLGAKEGKSATEPTKQASVTAPDVSHANPALKNVEATAKALEGKDTDNIDWVSKKEQETKTKTVNLKDGSSVTLKYLLDQTPDNTVAYILGFDNGGNQISTVMIEKGNDGRWRGNDLEVNKKYRRMGLATAMYDYADELGHNLVPTKSLQPDGIKFWQNRDKRRNVFVSEAYHKAKADGSNPELVKAVEDLLQGNKPTISKEQTEEATQEEIDATANFDKLVALDNEKAGL